MVLEKTLESSLEKTLESPLGSKEINKSILKEISPEYSLEGLMLKLKFWPPDAKRQFTGKAPNAGRLKAGGEEGDRR